MSATVLWFTGLSGSGKTTIAKKLTTWLDEQGVTYKVLDGDVVRSELHTHLGFSVEDIKENNRLISEMCVKFKDQYDAIIVPIISPFRISRTAARQRIGEGFVEVYIKASLEEVERRDVKGLYKRAREGKIKNFIGIDPRVPYEPPDNPEIIVDTSKGHVQSCVQLFMNEVSKIMENKQVES